MKNLTQVIYVTLLTVFLMGCSNDKNNPYAEPIGLQTQDENFFSGKTTIDNYTLVYTVNAINDLDYKASLQINDITLEAIVKYGEQTIDFDGKDAVLSLEDKKILLTLGEKISSYLFYGETFNDFTMGEYTLLRLLEYWAKSPNAYPYSKKTIKSPKSTSAKLKSSDEGITCIKKNTYVTAEYDDDSGNVSESILVNGSDCIGRCGSGCGSWFSWRSAWTKDCLDHDRCGRVNGGSTDPFDSECGDEYDEAADDYLFGVIRGCNG